MVWELTKPAQPRMEAIIRAVKGAERLVLATDPDREGEAISWHLLQELQVGGQGGWAVCGKVGELDMMQVG